MIYVLLPAYNEEQGIRLVLNRLIQMMPLFGAPIKVVVIDDGSGDKTSDVVRGFKGPLDIDLFVFERNRGVREVFRKGFLHIVRSSQDPKNDICVVLDSDNTQDPRVMIEMILRIRGGDDLVIASRFVKPGCMKGCTLMRHVYSIGLSWLMRLFIGIPGVKDYSMFYRAYRVSLLEKGFQAFGDALLYGKGFSAIGGCLVKLSNYARSISEVPLILRYGKKRSASGIHVKPTILGYFEMIRDSLRTDRFRKVAKKLPLPDERPLASIR